LKSEASSLTWLLPGNSALQFWLWHKDRLKFKTTRKNHCVDSKYYAPEKSCLTLIFLIFWLQGRSNLMVTENKSNISPLIAMVLVSYPVSVL
jgi:hypothetical protein